MTTHESTMWARLAQVQVEIGAIERSAKNPQTRSAYIPLGVMRARCLPVLEKHGLLLVHDSEIAEPYLMVRTHVIDCKNGNRITTTVPIAPQRPGANKQEIHEGATHYTSHAIASAITYGSRVGMQSLLGITDVDDDDGNAAQGRAQQTAPKAKPPARDIGARFAAIGSVIKSAKLINEMPEDVPAKVQDAMRDPAVRAQVGQMVATALQLQVQTVNTKELSDAELAKAADYWRKKRPQEDQR